MLLSSSVNFSERTVPDGWMYGVITEYIQYDTSPRYDSNVSAKHGLPFCDMSCLSADLRLNWDCPRSHGALSEAEQAGLPDGFRYDLACKQVFSNQAVNATEW